MVRRSGSVKCRQKTRPRGAGPSRQHPAVVSIVEARDAPERCLIYFFFAFTPRPAALRAGAFLLGALLLAPFFAPFDAVLLFATFCFVAPLAAFLAAGREALPSFAAGFAADFLAGVLFVA